MMKPLVEVGIIGEFDPDLRYHIATNEALEHAAEALSLALSYSWVSTRQLDAESVAATLDGFHGIVSAPGDYQNQAGAHLAIQFAREQGRPFFGT